MASAASASATVTAATMTSMAATSTTAASTTTTASATTASAATASAIAEWRTVPTASVASTLRGVLAVKVRLRLVGEIAAAFDGQSRRVRRSGGLAMGFGAAVLRWRGSAHLRALLFEDGFA